MDTKIEVTLSDEEKTKRDNALKNVEAGLGYINSKEEGSFYSGTIQDALEAKSAEDLKSKFVSKQEAAIKNAEIISADSSPSDILLYSQHYLL